MNALPFPVNPDVGEWSGNWVWNGARWVASPTQGLRVQTQAFTQSGAYMPSPGLVSLTVECVGGGGGGGGAAGTTATRGAGGGGGSGGYSRKTLPAALVRGGILVTVGAGGPAEYAANVSPAGAATSFGAFCVANGGQGGQWNNSATILGEGGSGAAAGIGDLAVPGNAGTPGGIFLPDPSLPTTILVVSGAGGAIFGGSGPARIVPPGNSQVGDGGTGPGAGGAGGIQNAIDTLVNGGAGADGNCVVTEFCWGDRDQPSAEWRPPLDVNVTMRHPKPPWPGGPPGPPPWPGGGPWPPGSPWWWWGPVPPVPAVPPRPREAIEFEAGQPYDQSINPETGLPWEDDT